MWDEIQIQFSDAYEIAEALINNEVNLTQLKSVPAFLPKADLTEEAVWDLCKSRNDYQRYLAIYPKGSHSLEIEELMWQAALQRNHIGGYLEYRNSYPQGIHVAEVDDRVWNVARQIGSYDAYLTIFPNDIHADWNYRKSINTINTISGYDRYLKIFPNGIHAREAKWRIAETLINDVVSITQLRSIVAFVDVDKEDMVEEDVWNLCESKNTIIGYLIYINIYPNGIHACEVDDRVFQTIFTIDDCRNYLTSFPNGNHAEEAKMLLHVLAMEEESWQTANRSGTLESYQSYMDSYPTHLDYYPRAITITHFYEAKRKIAELMAERKDRIIRALSENRNAYSLKYIKVCGITIDDLRGKIKDSKGQVRDEVLKSWDDIPEVLLMDTMPTHLPQGVPEIYVWGLPGSGKTCVLAAILSTANMMGYLEPCKGYVKQLSTLFIPKSEKPAVCLPAVSTYDPNRHIPITLDEKVTNRNRKETLKRHNLSIIEISGDIFECFSREIQGELIQSGHFEEIYRQLKAFLNNSDNPKYHFFILDGNRMQNPVQLDYWQRAAYYFQKGDVFNKATLGISLIVTKSDLLSPNRSEWVDQAKDYIMRYYASFVNTLKHIVGPHGLGLTDRKLSVIPFSIGEIFFKDLCIFNPESAKVLVDLLMCYADEGEKEWRWRNKGIRLHSFLKNGMGGIIDECLDSIEKRGFSPKGKITMTRNYGFVLNGLGGQLVIEDDTEQHLIKFEPSAEIVSIAATFKDEICLTAGGQIFTSRKGEDSFLDSDLMLYPIQLGSLCFFESISAGEGHIVGVNYDGTVFCWDDWRSWESAPDFKSMVKGWRNIKQVAVGYGNIIALTNDGKVLGSDEGFYKEYQDFIQVDAYGHYYGDSYSMALRSNGTVMSPNFEEVSSWHDIVQIAVGWDAAVGLRRNGGVNIVFYDDNVVKEVSSWTNIVNIECKFSQIIAISREGRIYNIKIH